MKKTSLFLILACLIYITGCSKKEEKPETTTKPQETTTTPLTTPVPTQTESKQEGNKPVEEKKSPEKNELRDKSGAIRVKFPAGSNEITLNGKINGFGDNITYVIDAKKGQGLYARVIAADPLKEPKANVRLGQIISPSGKADGPFGIKTVKEYQLTESGDWKIVISENQMSGNPWKGEYTLNIVIR